MAGDDTLAKQLISLMEDRRLTLRELSAMTEVPVSTLQGWRAGSAPTSFKALRRVAHALGVTITYLLIGEEEVRSPTFEELLRDAGPLCEVLVELKVLRVIKPSGGEQPE